MLRNWLIAGAVVAGVALALGVAVQLAERPESYRDAVREALDQRQIIYTDLEVREVCLPDPHCIIGDGTRTFVTVLVQGGAVSAGQLTCYDRRGDCYLDLAGLGIRRAPLRDLRSVGWMPKQVVREVARIVGLLRGTVRRDQSLFASDLSFG